MAVKEIWVVGIHVTDRIKDAKVIQDVLTKFGCSIKTRLGLHETSEDECSPAGLILLELAGNPAEFPKLVDQLTKVEGLEIKKMVFVE